jgi:hypothetical protein
MQALEDGKRVQSGDLPAEMHYQVDYAGDVHLHCVSLVDGSDSIVEGGLTLRNVRVGWFVQSDLVGTVTIPVHGYLVKNISVSVNAVIEEIVKQFPKVLKKDLVGLVNFEGFEKVQSLGMHRLTSISTRQTLFKVWLVQECGT